MQLLTDIFCLFRVTQKYENHRFGTSQYIRPLIILYLLLTERVICHLITDEWRVSYNTIACQLSLSQRRTRLAIRCKSGR